MATWWKPWTWTSGQSDRDNFIRNLPSLQVPGWADGAVRYGLPINEDTALRLSGVLCATRVIAEGMAQIPLKIIRETMVDGLRVRRPALDLPVYMKLHRRPNAWMTSFQWRETMTMHAVLCGNAFSIINRVAGEVDELIPVVPADVEVAFEGGVPVYRITIDDRVVEFAKEDVFHLAGPSMDGVTGLPIVGLAREMLGLSTMLENSQLELQRNSGRPSGILRYAGQGLSESAKQQLRDSWQQKFGVGGPGGIAVLENDWQFEGMTMSAVDQQLIENRKFQIDEIGRAFRVWPLMLMQADKTATFASSEQFFQAHVIHTLGPWVDRWEQTIDRDLLGGGDDVYAHFQVSGLMRGAAKDRAEYYAKSLGAGGSPAWNTQNDVREMEEQDPLPGGDVLFSGAQNKAPEPPPAETGA